MEECYAVLGLIHSLWTPVPGQFKDYIAVPKANFYQSLHTTRWAPKVNALRYKSAPAIKNRGAWHCPPHWAYKEGIQNQKDIEQPVAQPAG